ncbi:MAG: FAD-binding oxidoreductase [Gammaproteobacteria bacterium]|nr:FAD-binding oxidoreductase [Gammaproteobacteria bacterium]
MQRWNGWGDVSVSLEVPPNISSFLVGKMGAGRVPQKVSLESVVEKIPQTRLHKVPSFLITEPPARLKHAHGQSFPDLLALNTGKLHAFPDAIAYPTTSEEVRQLLAWATSTQVTLIPYGGGTSVVGHINPQPDSSRPIVTVDMGSLRALEELQPENGLAYFGSGVRGPDLESQLAKHGYTLGHFPQSFEYSTLGGWIASRSSGQQSYGYGRIEQLFRGGEFETPQGSLTIPPFPASATGLDLREVVLGSEGRMGILTKAIVAIKPVPEKEVFYATCFPDWEHGFKALRKLADLKMALSMLRLANAEETRTFFEWARARKPLATKVLNGYCSLRGLGEDKTLLLFALTGKRSMVRSTFGEVSHLAQQEGGIMLGSPIGHAWQKDRFRQPYLRNTLWDAGFGVDTLETATNWDTITPMMRAIEEALSKTAHGWGDRIHVFTHLSHVYATGCSLYTSYLFRLAPQAEDTLVRWQAMKEAASKAILALGGTISHQHGVGLDHRPYLIKEKGSLGVGAMQALIQHFDPYGIMNPGKLVPWKTMSL